MPDHRTLAATAVARTIAATAHATAVKGWRDQHPPTPHARFDVPIADYWAPRIQRALGKLWHRDDLHAAILAAGVVSPHGIRVKASTGDPTNPLMSSAASGRLRYSPADTSALEEALR